VLCVAEVLTDMIHWFVAKALFMCVPRTCLSAYMIKGDNSKIQP